ncbi:uncharacterized protein LOC124880119 isoform X2 [Girardinichthys multiradiatus]|uniref:uncharacterized protein LOC124880119 isoform X2 n=1 Tax=Girardinichthys multiradiatus TaxID=208333 RepID=UPI001FAD2A1E|nr:uncharacterized protein LOC124880119 isoform X2 [Girardinichthys multiradiatus]
MSLQVCYSCGWSKVTTYQGLRVHQGKMRCTPRGMSITEPQQQYMWGFAAQKSDEISYNLHVQATDKTDMSLQVCHCGWTKMTSYHGLRTHQGMMHCTPKGLRIPKEEQNAWKDYWQLQVDDIKRPVAKKVNMKQENSPETPRIRNLSNPAAAVTVKKENKSASLLPPPSSQRATRSKLRHQLEERATLSKNPKDYWSTVGCKNDATATSRIKEEPISPQNVSIRRYLDDHKVTPIKELEDSSLYLQMNHWLKENPTVVVAKQAAQPEEQYRSVIEHPTTPPAAPHEAEDPLLTPTSEQETPKSQLLTEIQDCLEKSIKKREEKMRNIRPSESAVENVAESFRMSTDSIIPTESMEKNQPSFPTQQRSLKKPKERKAAAAGLINQSVSKHPTPQPPVPPKRNNLQLFTGTAEKAERSSATNGGEILQSKEDSENAERVQNVGASPKVSSRLEKNTSSFATPPHLLKKPMDTKAGAAEQVSGRVLERPAAPPAVPPKRNSRTFRVKQLRGRELPNDLQGANNMNRELKVKELVRMFSVSAVQQKTAGPKEKPGSEHPQVKLLAQRHSTFPAQETRVRPTVEDREEQIATDITADLTPTAAERSQTEALSPSVEAAEPDISTSMKVKELAQMFSVEETAAWPKAKHGQGSRHITSQVKFRAQRFLQTTSQETKVQLKEEDHGRVKLAQSPDSTNTPTNMKTATSKASMHQEGRSSDEGSQLIGFSTGPKVKDLARMFSTKII